MIDVSIARTDQERLALSLLKAMEDGDLFEKIQTLCSDGFVWANSGLPTLTGKQAVLDHMAAGGFAETVPILKTMTHFTADILFMASDGGAVFTERVDHHWDKDGRDLMTPHICGIIEVHDGRITALRDFYDVVCYRQKPTAPDPEFALQAG